VSKPQTVKLLEDIQPRMF